jgi:hypothetical protein
VNGVSAFSIPSDAHAGMFCETFVSGISIRVGLSAKAFHVSEKFKPFKAIGYGDTQTQSSGQNPPKISNIKALEVALIPEFISNGEIWVIVPQ